ncbi:MAG: hypothetical protein AAFX85_20315 [Pseudomonadota bacterium]
MTARWVGVLVGALLLAGIALAQHGVEHYADALHAADDCAFCASLDRLTELGPPPSGLSVVPHSGVDVGPPAPHRRPFQRTIARASARGPPASLRLPTQRYSSQH